jgi:hypothetical protein
MAACSRWRHGYPYSACELLVLRRDRAIDEARLPRRIATAAEVDGCRLPPVAPTAIPHSN